jgi:hypothetical protein
MSSWKIWLPFTVAAIACSLDTQPVGAAAGQSGHADAVKWDQRNFNGIWLLVGGGLDDPQGSDSATGAPGSNKDLSDSVRAAVRKGLGHSSKMRIVQRIRLLDVDHLQIKGKVEDPEALVRPWEYTLTYHRHAGEEIVEYLCDDNNRESLDPKTGQEITEIPARRNQPKPK